MIIHVTSDHGQIGPLRWINSNLIPEEVGCTWLVHWGATYGWRGGRICFQEVKQ